MEQSPSREANSFSASQEIPRILWNSEVHYHVHNGPPSVPTLSQLDLVHNLTSLLILFSDLRLGLPSGLFPSGFPTKTLHTPFLPPHTRYMPRLSHSYRFYHPNYTDVRRLMTGVRSEKCVVRRFRCCANAIERTYTNLDSTV
jgi:hypothetical protein